MSAVRALLVLVIALGGGLFLLPWVGFMAVFVALALSGSIIGHFWSKYYLTPVAWVAVELLNRPSVARLLPRGTWRLALVALLPWLVAFFVIPGLVSTLVLSFLNGGGGAYFLPGALFGFGVTGLTAPCIRCAPSTAATDRHLIGRRSDQSALSSSGGRSSPRCRDRATRTP